MLEKSGRIDAIAAEPLPGVSRVVGINDASQAPPIYVQSFIRINGHWLQIDLLLRDSQDFFRRRQALDDLPGTFLLECRHPFVHGRLLNHI